MKNYLIHYLLITLSIFLNSCTEGFKEEYSKLVMALTEVTAITTPTTDTTPDYTFSSTGSGSITYGGSCSSSTTSAISGNNTITLNTLSVDTYVDCTITVSKTIFTENSEKKLSGSLTITPFTVSSTVSSSDDSSSYSPGWQLIARQVDSDNFTDGTDELFSSNARTTFLQNEIDNSSSTFMSIGHLTRSNYVTDGKYKFKLVWDGMQVDSLDNKSVTWTQASWLTDTTITGFEEIGVSGFSYFTGLGKSGSPQCGIDGNGGSSHWYNCVGVDTLHTKGDGSEGMPGPLNKIASSMHLFIWTPEIKETNYALDFDGSDDYVSIPNNPFSNKNTFTIQAWLRPLAVGDNAYHGFIGIHAGGRKPSLWVSPGGDLHYDSKKGSQRFTGTISDGSNTFFAANEWIHVAWTNDASNYKFYKNGNLVDTVTAPDTFNALDNIGYEIGRVDNYFNGQIDEVAIWDVALGSANITALYNFGIGLKASVNSGNYDKSGNLVGYWQFNDGTGSALTDYTSNSNNGTLNNMNSSSWVPSGLNLTN